MAACQRSLYERAIIEDPFRLDEADVGRVINGIILI